ncbi:MAG: hypothetical protein SWY16_08090 [Cyanobacteriota bacterium]|nr:hypothetical protein [Cyanobacteriota bacterium]
MKTTNETKPFLFNRVALSSLALALGAIVLPACSTTEETEAGGGVNVTTEEVASDPEALDNQLVTIRSAIVEKVSDTSFLVEDETLVGGEQILVINTTGEPFIFPSDDDTEIQITGEVTPFVLADVEREFNLGLDPEVYVEYETKPAIVATSLALAPDPGEITENPEAFYNQRIAVEGEVDEIRSAETFTLDEEQLFGGEDLLVVNLNPTATMKESETVTVTGVLRPFVEAEFEKDYELGWDLNVKEQIEAEYSEKPVFVADEVYPSRQ